MGIDGGHALDEGTRGGDVGQVKAQVNPLSDRA